MKILHCVESYLPAVHGMQEVVKQISERLKDSGHEVVIATRFNPDRESNIINGIKIEQFKISGNQVNGYEADQGELERYKKYILNSGFDIITSFASQQWATDLVLPILNQIQAKKVFVPTGFSALYSDAYRDYFDQMPEWMRQYDMNVFLSDNYRDINFAKENNIENRILIPNGACEKEFLSESKININKLLNISPETFVVLNVSGHTGVKGHRETIDIYKQANIPNSILLLVAKGTDGCALNCRLTVGRLDKTRSFKQKNKSIKVLSLDRPETIAVYQRADLFLFPSNIECSPLVIFEACASKTPFLATDVGNVREIINWTKGGELLPTQQGVEFNRTLEYKIKKVIKKSLKALKLFNRQIDFVDYNMVEAKISESVALVEKLYQDKDLRKNYATKGFNNWQQKFTWQKIARDYEKLYQGLLK